jgi:hypothetical protein
MYKEILSKFSGLNIQDIYDVIVTQRHEMKDRFNNWENDPLTRAFLMEYFVYFLLDKVELFNPLKLGPDFHDDDGESFDLKCITLPKEGRKLSGDTPISSYDHKSYDESNVIKKLDKLLLLFISRTHTVEGVYFFNKKHIDAELRSDWDKIMYHIDNGKRGNVKDLEYLRCKKIINDYEVYFNRTMGKDIINVSDPLYNDEEWSDPIEYILKLKERYSRKKLISLEKFIELVNDGQLIEVYNNYVS